MRKYQKQIYLICGIILLLTGVLFILRNNIALSIATYTLSTYMIINGVYYNITKQVGKIRTIINIIFGVALITLKNNLSKLILIGSKVYLLAIFLINLTSFLISRIEKTNNNSALYNTILNLLFLVILQFNPTFGSNSVLLILGIYLIILGLKNIYLFLMQVIPKYYSNKIKKIVEFPIPVIFSPSITRKLELYSNNTSLDKGKKPNFYILIHSSDHKKDIFGHIELAIDGTVYSYGNYNRHSRKLFSVFGDGIICTANKEKYIDYCTNVRKKQIAEFGIILTPNQKKKVKQKLERLVKENTEDYYSDIQLKEQGLLENRIYKDFSSELYLYADAKYKKVIKGKNKIFFLAMNNCTLFARDILSSCGNDVLIVNGISSPGVYFDYLNSKYQQIDSNVVTRKIYKRKDEPNEKSRTIITRGEQKMSTSRN